MTAKSLDKNEILQRIPHRPPFLWIDEVIDMTPETIHARKFLSPELDVFSGHYPGNPILPGVLQCEAAFQAGAILISEIIKVEDGKVPVVTRLNNVKFRRPIKPGETLDIEVEFTERLQDVFFLKGKVSVDGQVATRLEFACTATAAP
ncbi:MAG: 3-hydroxyacyl-ACP dehydratase FabZ family protein [Planctomycetaceae bacterium]